MNKVITFVGILIAIVIIAVSAFSLVSSVSDIAASMNSITNAILTFGDERVGASGTRFPNGISADTTSPVAGEVRGTTATFTGDTVFDGGVNAINVTTSNTATSSITVGCINMYATSTATSWRAYASSTATIEGVDGVMLMEYGTCPKI